MKTKGVVITENEGGFVIPRTLLERFLDDAFFMKNHPVQAALVESLIKAMRSKGSLANIKKFVNIDIPKPDSGISAKIKEELNKELQKNDCAEYQFSDNEKSYLYGASVTVEKLPGDQLLVDLYFVEATKKVYKALKKDNYERLLLEAEITAEFKCPKNVFYPSTLVCVLQKQLFKPKLQNIAVGVAPQASAKIHKYLFQALKLDGDHCWLTAGELADLLIGDKRTLIFHNRKFQVKLLGVGFEDSVWDESTENLKLKRNKKSVISLTISPMKVSDGIGPVEEEIQKAIEGLVNDLEGMK